MKPSHAQRRAKPDYYKLALSKLRTAGRQRRRLERKAKLSQSHAFLILKERMGRAITEGLAFDLAHYFGAQSQAFDKVRFLKACGIGGQS